MTAKKVLIDTGPLVAMLRSADEHHGACVEQARSLARPAFTCWPVITEAAYLLRHSVAGRRGLTAWLKNGENELLPLSADDVPGIEGVLEKYSDQGVDLADAALVHLADREGIGTVFTLDRRDFSVYRQSDGKAFELLP